jgi:hypothetical protein
MSKFVNINADTDASRIGIIARELWPNEMHDHDVRDGQITVSEDRVAELGRALDARGITWGWA